MSNRKLEATFHPDDEPDKPTVPVPGMVHLQPDDPSAPVPHAHMDEH